MKSKITAAIAAAVFLLAGCEEKPPIDGDGTVYKNFIQLFYDFGEIELNVGSSGWENGYVRVRYNDVNSAIGRNAPNFQELCDRFGDGNYYRKLAVPNRHPVILNEFDSIDVVSENDFNDYPAGTSLKDIVRIVSSSPHQYIQNGYTGEYHWGYYRPADYFEHAEDRPGYYPVNKPLNDLLPSDLILLNPECLYFLFLETPAVKQQTLTFIFHEGDNEIRATGTVTFE